MALTTLAFRYVEPAAPEPAPGASGASDATCPDAVASAADRAQVRLANGRADAPLQPQRGFEHLDRPIDQVDQVLPLAVTQPPHRHRVQRAGYRAGEDVHVQIV